MENQAGMGGHRGGKADQLRLDQRRLRGTPPRNDWVRGRWPGARLDLQQVEVSAGWSGGWAKIQRGEHGGDRAELDGGEVESAARQVGGGTP